MFAHSLGRRTFLVFSVTWEAVRAVAAPDHGPNIHKFSENLQHDIDTPSTQLRQMIDRQWTADLVEKPRCAIVAPLRLVGQEHQGRSSVQRVAGKLPMLGVLPPTPPNADPPAGVFGRRRASRLPGGSPQAVPWASTWSARRHALAVVGISCLALSNTTTRYFTSSAGVKYLACA